LAPGISARSLGEIWSTRSALRLRSLADQTLVVLRKIPGAADTFLEQAQLRIQIDRRSVAHYGINIRDVEDVIEMVIGGKAISTVFEGEKRFDVAVRFQEPARADADTIGNILIPTHDGGRVPLSQLARIEVVNGASIIARRENIRQISVRTNIRGRDQGSL
jgi:cobalt-zinc-cadmium resistance protein CzcA